MNNKNNKTKYLTKTNDCRINYLMLINKFLLKLLIILLFTSGFFLFSKASSAQTLYEDQFNGNNNTIEDYNSSYKFHQDQIYVGSDHAYTVNGVGSFAIYGGIKVSDNCTSIQYQSYGWVSIIVRSSSDFTKMDRIDVVDGVWTRYFHNLSINSIQDLPPDLNYSSDLNTIHNLKACVKDSMFTAFLDNKEFFSTTTDNTEGYSGFGAYDPTNFLDNFKIESTTDKINLSVPLIKQTNAFWANQTYDNAQSWSPHFKTISDWGCALTSYAMVLNYYGYNKLPNGQALDPGTLNS